MKKVTICVLLCFFSISCSQQRIFSKKASENTKPSYESSQAFFIYGIGQTKETNVKDICKDKGGVEKTETILTFVDGLLGFITLGIYTPRTVRIYCKS